MMSLVRLTSLGMNRDREVSRPTIRWIYLRLLGLRISTMTLHFSGFASMPR